MNQQREEIEERVEVDLIEIAENARLMMHKQGRDLEGSARSLIMRRFDAMRGKRDVSLPMPMHERKMRGLLPSYFTIT